MLPETQAGARWVDAPGLASHAWKLFTGREVLSMHVSWSKSKSVRLRMASESVPQVSVSLTPQHHSTSSLHGHIH